MPLDRYLKRDLANFAKDRPSQDVVYLSTKQIEYILTGEVGGYSAGILEDRIEDDVADLPYRFQRLINDIGILKYGGFLDETADLWNDFHELNGYARYLVERPCTLSAFEEQRPEIVMGYDFGIALSTLSGSAYQEPNATDFLWGLLLAYCTPHSGSLDDESENMEAVFDDLQERRKRHFETAISHATKGDRQHSQYFDRKAVDDFLDWCEFEVTPLLHSEIISHVRMEVLEKERDAERVAAEYVEFIVDEYHLKEVEEVRSKLKEEWRNLPEILAKRVETKKMLKALWDLGPSNSREVSQEIDEDQPQQVTEAFNKLAENGKRPAPSLEPVHLHGPLVEWVGNRWKVTDYGCLLCFHVFEKGQSAEWIYTIAQNINRLGQIENFRSEEFAVLLNGAEPTLIERLF
ncbi:hypothetical protein ACLI4R_17655 [Natrialbaceae archaeon A-chndr2]